MMLDKLLFVFLKKFFIISILIVFANMQALNAGDLFKGYTAFEKKDYLTSFNEFSPLAEEGDPLAEFFLGLFYKNGFFVEKDINKAIKWYELSASKGNVYAQNNLGLMHEKGLGFPVNYEKAFKMYLLSAEEGYAVAQYNLGIMYYNGKGVEKSIVDGFMWINISSLNGDDDGEELKLMMTNEMTETQIEQALLKTKNCIKKNLKKC